LAALLAACGGGSNSASTTTSSSGGGSKVLVGAGSTFVYPLVSQWVGDYSKRSGVTVTYGAIGSGGGIAAITDRTVDFGASDAPLTPEQLTKCKGCVEIPWALGGTSIAYNLKGAPQHLKLTGPVLADIFLGKITAWNDPAIAKVNSGATLPATRIAPVFRSDGSGTSYNFTDYLSRVSPTWKAKVGVTTQPAFPTGQGAKGSSGVAGVLSHTDGAITYVDVAYATTSNLSYAAIQNAAKTFTLPDVSTCKSAATAASAPQTKCGHLDRRPARLGRERLSDLHVQLRDRPETVLESSDAEGLPGLRGHDGPAVRAEAAVRAAAGGGCRRRQDGDSDDQLKK
jgi:phosphate transport system substrate-binding protein